MPDYEEFIFAVGLFLLSMAKSSDCEFLQKNSKTEDFKMKKVTTMAIIGGKERQISVYIEEELADWLDTIDEATRRDFIV